MEELLSITRTEKGEEPDPVESHKSVSRMTLRQVLLAEMNGLELQNMVLAMIQDWDPRFQSLTRMSDPSTITLLPIHSSVPIQHWETKIITLVGDAIHSMTPMRGIGAKIKMVQYGFDAVRSSMKAAEQSISENAVALAMMKMMFRLIDALPPIKRWIFRNFGNS